MIKFKKIIGISVSAIMCSLIVFFIVTQFIFIKIEVPTGSMYPTIYPYDRLYVVKDTNLVRGDIAVFFSEELGINLVKRTIGLPGDKVMIVEGSVFVNGEKLEEDYVVNKDYSDGFFEVPKDCFFFLGDNRESSKDARSWENPFIPHSQVLGKAVYRFYPIVRAGIIE